MSECHCVWAWGKDQDNQLGDGDNTNTNKLYPVPVHGVNYNGFLTDVIEIDSGYSHSLALKVDGTLVAWGYGSNGQLGSGMSSSTSVPVAVQGLTEVTYFDAGVTHSLAYQSDGSLWSWGTNNAGQLGNGSFSVSNAPIQVMEPDRSNTFSVGAYLPDKKYIYEEEERVIVFSVSDPEGGIVTLDSATSDETLLPSGNVYFVTSVGNYSNITLSLSPGEEQLVTLHVESGIDEYG